MTSMERESFGTHLEIRGGAYEIWKKQSWGAIKKIWKRKPGTTALWTGMFQTEKFHDHSVKNFNQKYIFSREQQVKGKCCQNQAFILFLSGFCTSTFAAQATPLYKTKYLVSPLSLSENRQTSHHLYLRKWKTLESTNRLKVSPPRHVALEMGGNEKHSNHWSCWHMFQPLQLHSKPTYLIVSK